MKYLVDDVKLCWKWFSTWLLAANGTFVLAYSEFQAIKDFIPPRAAHWIMIGLFVLTFLGRIIKQSRTK